MTKRQPVRLNAKGKGYLTRVDNAVRQRLREPVRRRLRRAFAEATPGAVPPAPAGSPSIAMLGCKRDLEMLIAAMKSHVLAYGGALRFRVHEDGSFSDEDVERLRATFPDVYVIRRAEADALIGERLRDYPAVAEWRAGFHLALKAVDIPIYAQETVVRFVDSDVLARGRAEALYETPPDGHARFNRDIDTSYIATVGEFAEAFDIHMLPEINSGVWVAPREAFSLGTYERLLTDPTFRSWIPRRRHVTEQTLIAVTVSRHAEVAYLPDGYDVTLERAFPELEVKHYVGGIRHGFELEGLRYLLRHGNLRERWMGILAGDGARA